MEAAPPPAWDPDWTGCTHSAVTCAYALQALTPQENEAAEAHIAVCPACRAELESLLPVVGRFAFWRMDLIRPPAAAQSRLARRIAAAGPASPPPRAWSEPEWEEVAPGIACKLLATDSATHRVSMLVRLAPGASYPVHIHAGDEELHLLDGELWIDGRRLSPGDYSYRAAGAADFDVWSRTGCTCFLTTSTSDVLC
jgi:anti-sigma factor ChrR (cupin superfamily)